MARRNGSGTFCRIDPGRLACRNDKAPPLLIQRRCARIQKPDPAEKARGGEIILNAPARWILLAPPSVLSSLVLAQSLTFLRAFDVMASNAEVSGVAHLHVLLPWDPFRAFSSVATKYSSRSRWNFSCIALKLATRAAISVRALAGRSLCSTIAHPF